MKKLFWDPIGFVKTFFTPVKRWAFFSALILSFITHFYFFANTFLNHDWVLSIYTDDLNWNIGQGRWASNFFRDLMSTRYSMVWVISLISIVFLALTSVVIVQLFNVKNKLSAVLISGIMVTFPVVASSLSYLPFADGYFLCAFLGSVAVLLTEKYKYGFLAGVPLIVILMGIYQAYWSFAAMLSFLCIFIAIFNSKTRISILWCKCRNHFLLSLFGIGAYFALNTLIMKLTGIGYIGNQGAYQFGASRFSPAKLIKFADHAYGDFRSTLSQQLSGGTIFNFRQVLIFAMLILLMSALIYLIISKQIYKSISKSVIFIILALLTPIVNEFAYIVSDYTFYHILMKFSYVIFFIAVIIFFEKLKILTSDGKKQVTNLVVTIVDENKSLRKQIMKLVVTIVSVLLIFEFFLLDNLGYYNMQLRYESDYSLASRIIDRMQSYPGYNENLPVAVVMNFTEVSMTDRPLQHELYYMIGMNTESFLYFNNFNEFGEKVFNIQMTRIDYWRMADIKKTSEYKALAYWPAQNCVAVVNGVMVVKVSD